MTKSYTVLRITYTVTRYSGEASPETPHHHPHLTSPVGKDQLLRERIREMV